MKKNITWFILCNIIFILSTFLHECAHGLQSYLARYPVSTGFNRVGNVYKFPQDFDFRYNFGNNQDYVIDAAVILTLLLAVIFTVTYYKRDIKNEILSILILSVAYCNAVMRVIPSLMVVILALFRSTHIEDESGVGQVWGSMISLPYVEYLPAIISIVISIVCIHYLHKSVRSKYTRGRVWINNGILSLALISAFIIENYLDGIIRINWIR